MRCAYPPYGCIGWADPVSARRLALNQPLQLAHRIAELVEAGTESVFALEHGQVFLLAGINGGLPTALDGLLVHLGLELAPIVVRQRLSQQ